MKVQYVLEEQEALEVLKMSMLELEQDNAANIEGIMKPMRLGKKRTPQLTSRC